MSMFNYCSIIWMFCGKTAHDKIDKIQKRALQALYNDFESNFNSLLNKGNHLTIHELNKRKLLIEVYKCVNKLAPPFLNDIFKIRNTHQSLRINDTLVLPKTSTKSWGLHSIAYRGSRSWNSLSDTIKSLPSLSQFKNHLQTIDTIQCSCKLCNLV